MRSFRTILLCILVVSFGSVERPSIGASGEPTRSQEIPRGLPEDAGMSSEGLKKVDEVVQAYIDEGRVPGVVVGISRRNTLVYLKVHGILEPSTGETMREDTIFIMASSSKPVIGVAALVLFDDGLIKLDDPVSKYIPEYAGLQVAVPVTSGTQVSNKKKWDSAKLNPNPVKGTTKQKTKAQGESQRKGQGKTAGGKAAVPDYRLEPVARPLTIHDLLTHTAGVGTRGGLGALINSDRAGPSDTLATWVPRMAKRPLDFQPGTRRAYSANDGLKVVSRIIEIVSGMPVNEFIQTRILDPLDMKDTHWDVPEDKLHRMPLRFHDKARGTGKLVGENGSAYVSGAGGLFSTTRDYLRFQQMLLNGGTLFGQRILKPETVTLMTTNQVGDLSSKSAKGGPGVGNGYTTGVTLDQATSWNGRIAGSYGWGGAAGTVSWTTPSEDLTVVYMVQQPSDLHNKITAVVQDAIID